MISIPYKKFSAGLGPYLSGNESANFDPSPQNNFLISCVMVTRGDVKLVKSSYLGFKNQTWQSKELIIVCDSISEELRMLVDSDREHVTLVEAQPGNCLGDLRNLSISKASGEFICQWDDDDLYDPNRLSACLKVLLDASVDAVFLNKWLMWWAAKNLLTVSSSRIWEGSMLAKRSAIPIYSAISKKEDTIMVNNMLKHSSIALIDFPELYCYRVTGQNTWDNNHFESLFNASSHKFSDEEIPKIMGLPCFRNIS